MTTKQVKYVRGLLAKAGLSDEKDRIVLEYTDGRTTHLTEMDYGETQRLIAALLAQINPLRPADTSPRGGFPPASEARDRMVRKILSMAHDMLWEMPGSKKVDMKRVNDWCIKYTKHHCPLDEVPTNELPKVVTNFEKVHRQFLENVK